MIIGTERHIARPVRRTLSQNTPQLNGLFSFVSRQVSNATDYVGEKARDVGHAVATQVRKVPGGSMFTSAVGDTYSLATDVTDAIGAAVGDVFDFMERQVRSAVKAAVRPIVRSFRGDSPFFLGADEPGSVASHLQAAKNEIIAASMAAGSSAGAAIGSVIPGVGSAAGAAAGGAITPSVVSELIQEIIDEANKARETIAPGAAPATTSATPAYGQQQTNLTPWLVGGAIAGALYFTRRR
jgi:hypothetical protein